MGRSGIWSDLLFGGTWSPVLFSISGTKGRTEALMALNTSLSDQPSAAPQKKPQTWKIFPHSLGLALAKQTDRHRHLQTKTLVQASVVSVGAWRNRRMPLNGPCRGIGTFRHGVSEGGSKESGNLMSVTNTQKIGFLSDHHGHFPIRLFSPLSPSPKTISTCWCSLCGTKNPRCCGKQNRSDHLQITC